MSIKDLLEALAAGGAGAALILALLRWMFRGHFYDLVLDCFNVRAADVKTKLELIFKDSLEERERWYEEIRRNQHSISGLDTIMVRHEAQLLALQSVPVLMAQQVLLMQELKQAMEENRTQVADHAQELAVLIDRRNNPR